MIFDKLKKTLLDPKATAAQLDAALVDAREAEVKIRADVSQLEARRADDLLADDAVQEKNRAALAKARDDLERSGLFIVRLETAVAKAVAVEEHARRTAHYAEAKVAVDAGNKAFAGYVAAAAPVLKMLKAIEDGHAAAERANAALPEGVEPLAVQDPRAVASTPRKTLRESVVELWAHEGGTQPFDEGVQAKVKPGPDGYGYLPSQVTTATRVVKRKFRRTEAVPATAGHHPDRLLLDVNLPGLFEPPLQVMLPTGYKFRGNVDHEQVLASLDQALKLKALGPPAKETDKPVVQFEPVYDETELQAAE